jgi:dihydroxyacetone kinase-like protein
MTGDELRRLLITALPRVAEARDELRDLDAAIGDGDLGVTVGDGALAATAALADLAPDATPAAVLRTVGMTLARANPSTVSALAMGGLLAAAKELGEAPDVDLDSGLRAARAAADSISIRGKSAVGDKTVLDALVPSLDAAAAATDAPLSAAIVAARDGVERTRGLVSQRGRAAWVGERTAGHADGGATAWVRILEAIEAEVQGKDGPT